MFAIVVSILACVAMILCIIFKPNMTIKGFKLQTFWIAPFIAAIILMIFKSLDVGAFFANLFSTGSMNPLKILILFFSMTLLSIFLDEAGFFRYLAKKTVSKANSSQTTIFIYLYLIISFITIISSNDVIILTFTPFICYFTKEIKVNPIPYLFMEFIAANTWSTLLIIGNPTNIYIATTVGIDFMTYFVYMIFPALVIVLTSFALMLLIFRKQLKVKPKTIYKDDSVLENKVLCIIGQIHLFTCIGIMAISNYINLEMWYIPVIFSISLIICWAIHKGVTHDTNMLMASSLKRLPWILAPFVLSMFAIVFALEENDIIQIFANFLNIGAVEWSYGIFSFLIGNLINNIPMSVLMSSVITTLPANASFIASLATIISSNLTTILTPLGSLAGIMWLQILKENDVNFKFVDFVKYGVVVSLPTIALAFLTLTIYPM